MLRSSCAILVAVVPTLAFAQPLVMTARDRAVNSADIGGYEVRERSLRWDPKQTAIIICDMWDKHWCQGATRRVGEIAPAMNRTVQAARAKGIFIIHSPSSCMDAYKDSPARKRALTRTRAARRIAQ